MSTDLTISCPKCGDAFELTEALAGPLLEAERTKARAEGANVSAAEREAIAEAARKALTSEYAGELLVKDKMLAAQAVKLKSAEKAELAALQAKMEADEAHERTELEVARRVDAERGIIVVEATKKAAAAADTQLTVVRAQLAERDKKIISAEKAELAALQAKKDAEEALQRTELEVVRRVEAEREAIATEAKKKAEASANSQLAAVRTLLAEKDNKLVVAQQAELDALRLQSEAIEAKREAELTVARRLEEERGKERAKVMRERDEEYRLKVAEKDVQMRAMQAQIEELRRTGASTSQQLIGDVLEVDLLITLNAAFPMDRFERVKKGHRGADVLQMVMSAGGAACGTIIWESKRTKAWSALWLGKLREDQRAAKADIAALATETLPDGQACFEERDGVWITPLVTVVPVAAALRHLLIDVAMARRAGALADTTKNHVFAYLTSPQFRQRVSRIVEGYADMRTDLDKEKRATETAWNKRAKQLDRILGGMTGFYGDLQGIAGASLPPIDGLMLAAPQESHGKPQVAVATSDTELVESDSKDPLLS